MPKGKKDAVVRNHEETAREKVLPADPRVHSCVAAAFQDR